MPGGPVSAVRRHKPVGSGVGLISASTPNATVSTIRCEPSRSVAKSGTRRRADDSHCHSRPGRLHPATGPGDEGGLVEAFATAAALNAEPTLAAAQQAIPGTLDAVALLAAAADSDNLSAYENPTLEPAGRRSTCCRLPRTSLRWESTRVLTVGVRGFDTHADQVENHQALLQDLASGLASFFTALEARADLDR